MEISKHVKWSRKVEKYFKEVGEQCACYAVMHKKSETMFSYRTTWIDLPVIVLSTICGTLTIGESALFGGSGSEGISSLLIGTASITVSILNTIGTYFGWSKRTESHRISSIEYAKMERFLRLELRLPPTERMHASDLLKLIRETYERLAEISPLIPESVIKQFKAKYSTLQLNIPKEANGIHEIEMYEPDSDYEESYSQPPAKSPVALRKSCRFDIPSTDIKEKIKKFNEHLTTNNNDSIRLSVNPRPTVSFHNVPNIHTTEILDKELEKELHELK